MTVAELIRACGVDPQEVLQVKVGEPTIQEPGFRYHILVEARLNWGSEGSATEIRIGINARPEELP